MAGEWVKMRVDLDEDPAVIGIALTLEIPVDHVVGKLWKVWRWASLQTVDGNATIVTASWLDSYVECKGFAAAMEKVGWLDIRDDGLGIPNFDRHNSETAKQRALTAYRVRRHKAKKGNDGCVTREEKRREDPPAADAAEGDQPEKDKTAKRDLFEAVLDVTASDRTLSGALIGRTAKQLFATGYRAADVTRLRDICGKRGFTLPLTPGTVLKYIGWTRELPSALYAQKAAQEDRQERIRQQRELEAKDAAEAAPPGTLAAKMGKRR